MILNSLQRTAVKADNLSDKNNWGTLVPRINVENGIKLGFVLE
jgi:hypothetical protein